jgi:Xaa-Pro aminopeptidase
MQSVCRVTAQAHTYLLKTVVAGMTEHDAAAEFQRFVLRHGCHDLGYSSIFASGRNATTLHYHRNNEVLKEGDLLLVDAAGEMDHYTADLTQTFPVGAAFSAEQKKVYEKVLGVNRAITQKIRPGVTYRELHQLSCEWVTEALLDLGVLKGELKNLMESRAYRPYYMHGLGHFLGLDVHDAGIYDHHGMDVKLEPGMILTNEPGMYFRNLSGPFAGVGVRIEDDILVTQEGCEVLTRDLPREVEAIEDLRRQAYQ